MLNAVWNSRAVMLNKLDDLASALNTLNVAGASHVEAEVNAASDKNTGLTEGFGFKSCGTDR